MNISFDSCPKPFYLEVHGQFEAMVTQREPKKPRVPTDGLAKEWDESTAVRDYLRDNPKEPLFHDNFKVSVKGASCQYVYDILRVILLRSCDIESQPQPPVRPLREQIALLYQKTSREPTASEALDGEDDDAWDEEQDGSDSDDDADSSDSDPEITDEIKGKDIPEQLVEKKESKPVCSTSSGSDPPVVSQPSGPAAHSEAALVSKGLDSAHGTEQLKIETPAADNLETQPLDVMKLSPPESLPATSSPEVPTEKLRQQYQQADKPAETVPKKVKKTKSKSKDVVKDGMGGKLDTKDNTSKEFHQGLQVKEWQRVPEERKKRGKGKAGKGKKKASTKVGVSRKRKVLKVVELFEHGNAEADETNVKKKRTSRSSSSKVATSADEPAKTRKAKGEAAAPKSKAKAKPGPKAKAKASPKGKAAPKPKARGRSKKQPGDDFLERNQASPLFEANMVKEMGDFAKSFDQKLDVKGDSFKEAARAHDPGFTWFRLNIYWSRCSCGVTNKETGKDATSFSFNTSSACDVHKISIAIYCAIHTATLQIIALFQK
eukprot:s5066_g3.t1